MSAKTKFRTGQTITIISVLFLIFDAVGKFAKPEPVVKAFTELGYPIGLSFWIGAILLVCTSIYAIPRTSILGAVLLTGYLGGAVASQMRVGKPVFDCVFPLLFAALLWGGLLLRDDGRLRAVLRLQSRRAVSSARPDGEYSRCVAQVQTPAAGRATARPA